MTAQTGPLATTSAALVFALPFPAAAAPDASPAPAPEGLDPTV